MNEGIAEQAAAEAASDHTSPSEYMAARAAGLAAITRYCELTEGGDPPALDYKTIFGALMEMVDELRAMVGSAETILDRHERGALAEMTDQVEALTKLYSGTLRLLANPPVL